MEAQALLNRITAFSQDNVQKSDACNRLLGIVGEGGTYTSLKLINVEDVPLDAIMLASELMGNYPNDSEILCAISAFLSFCCIGDNQTVKRYLIRNCSICKSTEVVLSKCLTQFNSSIYASSSDTSKDVVLTTSGAAVLTYKAIYSVIDLVVSLAYNNGEARGVMGAHVGMLVMLLRALLDREQYTNHAITIRGNAVKTIGSTTLPSLAEQHHFYEVIFGIVCGISVLTMNDIDNTLTVLRLGVDDIEGDTLKNGSYPGFRCLLHLFRCLHCQTNGLRAVNTHYSKESGNGFTPKAFIGLGDMKEEIIFWTKQAILSVLRCYGLYLRKLQHDAEICCGEKDKGRCDEKKKVSREKPLSGAPFDEAGDFGRFGECIAVDEFKWELKRVWQSI